MNPIDRQFISGLETGNRNLIMKVPKSDLHCHSGLAFKIGLLKQYAEKKIKPAPAQMSSISEMNLWIKDELANLYNNRDVFEFALRSALSEAVDDGITLLEMSIDVSFISLYGNNANPFADIINEYRSDFSSRLSFRPELGISRDTDPSVALPLAEACLETGAFICIDLYGTEDARPPEVYKEFYIRAKKGGVKCKVHLGEFGDAQSLLHGAQILLPDAIQHGIAAAGDKEVMQWLATRQISLNICPTSNIRMSRVKDYRSHPIRRLFDAGVTVTLNSDDIMLFEQNVSDEYINLYNAGTFSAPELNQIRVAGLNM